jgi:filamentous hemagglutinin
VGYTDTTGTAVQPGGFMSAANMDLNAQTINQIGGALQVLGSDGSVDQAATQQFLAGLQQELGGNFTQTAVSDHLDTSFTAEGGFGVSQIVGLVFTVVVTIMSAGAASAAIGATLGETAGSTFAAADTAAGTTAGLGNATLSAAAAGFASSVSSQLTMTGSLNWGTAFEMAGVSAITAGLTNGITYNSDSGFGFDTGPQVLGGSTNSLAYLAGVNPAIGNLPNQATNATADWGVRGLAMLGEAGIAASVGTAIEGGEFFRGA